MTNPLTSAQASRAKLCSLLGDLPDRNLPIHSELLWEKECPAYRLQKLRLSFNGLEDTFAYVTLPNGAKPPYPAVVFNHSHGGDFTIGKEEYINGREYMYQIPYADSLSQAGFAGIAIDHWCFGERNHGSTQAETFELMLWQGKVLWGMMVYDSIRTVDYLASRPDMDPNRIGTLGMSMGSTMAWWLSALDERIRVCADICCMTDYQALIDDRGLERHGVYYFVPSLLKYFQTADINALIAPRPHLSINGRLDPLTPEPGLHKVDAALRKVYSDLGASEKWHMSIYETEHQELLEAREEVIAFLKKYL